MANLILIFCRASILFSMVATPVFTPAMLRVAPFSVCWAQAFKSCPALCDPMDYSPLGSSVHRILQARILEWVAISFSRGSS